MITVFPPGASASGSGGVDVYEAGASVIAAATRLDFKDLNAENPSGTLADLYLDLPHINNLRLTLESGVPASTTDQTGKGTLYWTPTVLGKKVSLFDGTRWKVYSVAEKSLSLTLTSGKNYDVFAYDNSGTVTLELSAAWTNDTTRADALTTQDGVTVKNGATTRRWLGIIRASGTNTCEDSAAKRFVFNAVNRLERPIRIAETNNTWTYTTTTTWRQVNASSANQIGFLSDGTETLDLSAFAQATDSSAGGGAAGGVFAGNAIGLDQASSPDPLCIFALGATGLSSTIGSTPPARLNTPVLLGYHFATWIEFTVTSGTTTFYGVYNPSGANFRQTGMSGTWRC